MKDPVALAYSGRIEEARAAAVAQARSADDFVASQALEALAVLGEQHGVRADPELDQVLVTAVEDPSSSRRAFEAALGLQSRALEPAAIDRLRNGPVSWEILRYAGELPSYAIGVAFAEGWSHVPARHLDQALLASCVMPVANKAECDAWGARVTSLAQHATAEVRVASMTAIATWQPENAAAVASRALEDESPQVRTEALNALARIDPELLAERAAELANDYPELAPYVRAKAKATKPRKSGR